MSARTLVVIAAAAVAAVAAVIFYVTKTDQRRYSTNNPNVNSKDFSCYSDNEDCVICLEKMNVNSTSTSLLSCGHFLHQACLLRMINSSNGVTKCPVCRTPLRYE